MTGEKCGTNIPLGIDFAQAECYNVYGIGRAPDGAP